MSWTPQKLWGPIFKHVNQLIGLANSATGEPLFEITKYANDIYIMQEGNWWVVHLSRCFLRTDIGYRCLGITLRPVKKVRRSYFQKTDVLFPLKGDGGIMQVGRNDVHHLNAGETGFFIITIVHDETCPWVSNGSRNGVKEEPVLTRPMMKIISMKLIINTQNHVFIFDVYLQY